MFFALAPSLSPTRLDNNILSITKSNFVNCTKNFFFHNLPINDFITVTVVLTK